MDAAPLETTPKDPPQAGSPAGAWEYRGRGIGRWLPYVTLGIAAVLYLLRPGLSWMHLGWTAALVVLAAAWVDAMYTRTPGDKRAHPLRMALYFAGLLALAGALMARHPIFFVFALTGLVHAADLRPWPAMLTGVGLTSILLNTIPTGFPWPSGDSWLIFSAIIVVQTLAVGFGTLLSEKLAELNEERRQTLARLEAALSENAALQAELVAQAHEAGIHEERHRLAREIHDTLAQGLIGIVVQLGAVQQAQDRPADWQRHLDHAQHLARESLGEARRSVEALRPKPLEDARLPAALKAVAQKWSTLTGVRVEMATAGDPKLLDPETEDALLRVAQEALANVAKHAWASRVSVTLSYSGEVVMLDVRDDGRGFDLQVLDQEPRAGFGLAAMRQRLSRVGGILTIESEPGGGTAVSARAPAHSDSQKALEG